MKLIVCAVRDSAVGSFLRPFYVSSVGEAVRGFGDEVVRGGDSMMTKHPEDYELFELGSWDDESASFTCDAPPRSISRAKDFVKGVIHEATSGK